ncbi:MAG: acyl-CoA thioesterase [Anaerolineae bacterium]
MDGKRVDDSRVSVNQWMMPEHANHMGFVHGGEIMKLADETGALSAIRHAQNFVVTLAVDSMTFHSPVQVGNLLTLHAHLTWVGRTSMEARVQVIAENPLTREQTHTNTAYFVYVALDENGHPVRVPPLVVETEEEKRRWAEAEERRQMRRSHQK